MKSIGIFGDSFTGVDYLPSYKYHWSSLLASNLGSDLTNYGKPGSSIYHSYKKFEQNYHKHDLNIFLVTEPSRYIKPVTLVDDSPVYVPGISALENLKKNMHTRDVETLYGWFLASDDNFNNDMAILMVEKVCELDNNCIIIKCFISSPVGNSIHAMPLHLTYLQRIQMTYFERAFERAFDNLKPGVENHDIISGHLLPEINEILFKIMLKKIETGVWDCKLPNHIKYKYSLDEVFKQNINKEII
jgi:hypothetical protein